jgi:hypothetical protein
VFFKNVPKKKRVEYVVEEIVTDPSKCKWSKKGRGNTPLFIRIVRKDKKQPAVWTCSDQLINAGFKK